MSSRTGKKRLRDVPATPHRSTGNAIERPSIRRRLPSSNHKAPDVPKKIVRAPSGPQVEPPVSDFSFKFTNDLRVALDEVLPVPADPAAVPDSAAVSDSAAVPVSSASHVRLNTVDEDLEDVIVNHSASGKGQNEMSHDWIKGYAQSYLNRILRAEAINSFATHCTDCNTRRPRFQCRDCLNNALLCSACLLKRHQHLPCHRFREWNGKHFQNRTAKELGYTFHLGHGGNSCNLGKTCDFTLGDTSGIHEIRVRFCRHPGKADFAKQLLDAHIFPCSDKRPQSGFTFGVLRKFHLLSTEAKLSSQRYYNVLVYQTSAMFPDQVPDRYREFMRVCRQWDHLQDLKWVGVSKVEQADADEGDLALRCPACPRKGINFTLSDMTDGNHFLYVLHLSYDGSFQLFRKNKAYDQWDICLSEGRKYFANRVGFGQHLARADAARNTLTTRDATCNNHKAAETGWVRYAGLAETGLGSVICARHSIFMPAGTVSFRKGERYTYADFVFAECILRAQREGVAGVGLHYDIMCHYVKNMWSRFGNLGPPLVPIVRDDWTLFLTAIPKFHLAGHTEGCFARYSLNYMDGVGRLDGEGGERCWANLNHSAGSTSEKGPGARVDAINHIMHHWNWSKIIRLPAFIHTKWLEAERMAVDQHASFLDLSDSIDSVLIEEWSKMSTDPRYENGRWVSVFSMTESPAMSMTQKLKELTEMEESADSHEGDPSPTPGAAAWIVHGMEIEVSQQRLKNDIKSWGSALSARQSLTLAARRKELAGQLTRHRLAAATWCPVPPVAVQDEADDIQGHPEHQRTLLPSTYAPETLNRTLQRAIVLTELELRRTNCLKALQTLRSVAMAHAHLVSAKAKHARGIKAVTRAEALTQRLQGKLQFVRWEYCHSRARLRALGMSPQDARTFLPLRSSDLQQLKLTVSRHRQLGEGRITLPWYWRVSLADEDGDSSSVDVAATDVANQYEESLRVQWFRARERYKRWEEEVHWLQREAASTLLDFNHRHLKWKGKAEDSDSQSDGWKAYAAKEAAMWKQLLKEASKTLLPVLENASGHSLPICSRAKILARSMM